MSKTLWAKYYEENKERLLKELVKDIKNLSKEEKEKQSNNMVVNVTKASQKMKSKSLLSIEKSIIEWEKNALSQL